MDKHLTGADVERLIADPSAETRASLAGKLGATYADGLLSDRERAVADDIIRTIARDVEVRVRAALARSICSSRELPVDVARRLANDVAEVAVPVLQLSAVLSDADLMAIVATQTPDHRRAIAGREEVSPQVASSLVGSGDTAAVAVLVANPGARLDEPIMEQVIDCYGSERMITSPLAERQMLPLGIAERLVVLVSDRVQERLIAEHQLTEELAAGLFGDSRDRVALLLSDGTSEAVDVYGLVEQLHAAGRLTNSLMLEALLAEDRLFFEDGLARRSGLSIAAVRDSLGRDVAERDALLARAGFDAADAAFAGAAFTALAEMAATDPETRRKQLAERVAATLGERLTPIQRALLEA